MFAENGLEVDASAVRRVFEEGDVITVGFTLFSERLLIDTRVREGEGPLVAIVGPVATVQERYLWLGKHRSAFGAPKNFAFFVWPHSVRSLVARNILQPLRERLAAVSSDGDAALGRAIEKLLELEETAMRAAIRGSEGWQTLWERSATPR